MKNEEGQYLEYVHSYADETTVKIDFLILTDQTNKK